MAQLGQYYRRIGTVIRRWLSIAAYGVVAAVLLPFIDRIFAPVTGFMREALASYSHNKSLLAVAVLIAAASWPLGRTRWRGFFGLSHVLTYPPIWVAAAIGIAVHLALVEPHQRGELIREACGDVQWAIENTSPIVFVVFLSVALLWSFFANYWSDSFILKKTGKFAVDSSKSLVFANVLSLQQWLRSDDEITSPSFDQFRHNDVAIRIARRLRSKDGPTTIALIGQQGSGKSTIRALVEHELRSSPNIRIVKVELWPFDSSEAAVRGILRAVVTELSQQVNVLPLRGLPDDYIAAVEKVNAGVGGLSRLIRGVAEPKKILARVSEITTAIGFRIVIWVEDLDRFSEAGQLAAAPHGDAPSDRLSPVRSLLYQLDKSGPNIAVVVSDSTLATRFDLEKLARFVERPPRMNPAEVSQACCVLRDHCLGGYPLETIDPAARGVRGALKYDEIISPGFGPLGSAWGLSPKLCEAIATVAETPRVLKQALRITLECWQLIPGEIDFDSVLVASIIRAARPDLFTFIDSHIDLLRHGFRNPMSLDKGKEEDHPARAELEELLKPNNWAMRAALTELLEFLFPKIDSHSRSLPAETEDRPQALFVASPTDYWRRYLSASLIAGEDSDQSVLQSIASWRNKRPSDLVARIRDNERSWKVIGFSGQFLADEIIELLHQVAEVAATESAAGWARGLDVPGFSALQGLMSHRAPDPKKLFAELNRIIDTHGAAHLPLSFAVVRFPSNRVSQNFETQLEKKLQESFKKLVLEDHDGTLIERALRGGWPGLLYHICRDPNRWEATHILNPQVWTALSNVLLTIAERNSTLGIQLILPFIAMSGGFPETTRTEEGKYKTIVEIRAELRLDPRKLFDGRRLRTVLSNSEMPSNLNEHIQAQWRLVASQSQSWTNDA